MITLTPLGPLGFAFVTAIYTVAPAMCYCVSRTVAVQRQWEMLFIIGYRKLKSLCSYYFEVRVKHLA